MLSYRSNLLGVTSPAPRSDRVPWRLPADPRRPSESWKDDEIDIVIDMLAAGANKAEAARVVGRPRSSVASLLERIELGHKKGAGGA